MWHCRGMLALSPGTLGADFTIVDAPDLVDMLREPTGRYQRDRDQPQAPSSFG